MELLIVVAIIAVLVAIAIPLFTSQLERSREATDLANVRSAYAEVTTAVMTEDASAMHDGTYIKRADGSYRIDVPLRQQEDDWQTDKSSLNIAGLAPGDANWRKTPAANGRCAVVYDPSINAVFIDWSGDGSIYDLSTNAGRLAADNARVATALQLLQQQSVEGLPARSVGSINDGKMWYMWYYDAQNNRLAYDYENTNMRLAEQGDLKNNAYGAADGHKGQFVAVARSADGETLMVGWTYQKLNNYYINWQIYDPEQGTFTPYAKP